MAAATPGMTTGAVVLGLLAAFLLPRVERDGLRVMAEVRHPPLRKAKSCMTGG